jgi:endonuclease/exonuclease/phosphatase family metal-dependent hydrolase
LHKELLMLKWTVLLLLAHHAFALEISTFNIRNFHPERTNLVLLQKKIRSISPDLLGVQEITHTIEFKKFIEGHLPEYAVATGECGGSGRQKLGLMYRKDRLKLEKFEEDLDINYSKHCHVGVRPLVIGHFKSLLKNSPDFIVVNAHLKAGNDSRSLTLRKEQYQILESKIKKLAKINPRIVVLGDLNSTNIQSGEQDFESIYNLRVKAKLDHTSEDLECTSFWSGNRSDGVHIPSTLDHVLITSALAKDFKNQETKVHGHCAMVQCQDSKIKNLGEFYQSVSDHCPIVTHLLK